MPGWLGFSATLRQMLQENVTRMKRAPESRRAVRTSCSPVMEPLTIKDGKLEGFEYLLEVSERGLVPSLRIESPDLILYRGREPGRGSSPCRGQ